MAGAHRFCKRIGETTQVNSHILETDVVSKDELYTGAAPRVSVVIPTYKHAQFVVRTLESVWKQSFQDFEIIVINDGSPDNTAEVLAPYVADKRITYYEEQPNGGQGQARNRGIAVARGEFVALLDDDDCLPPDKLEWQVAALQSNPQVGVVYGFPQPVNEAGQDIEPLDPYGNPLPWPWESPTGDLYEPMTERCWLVSPGQAMVRRSILDGIAFDPAIRGCDDWDLWLRIAEKWPFLFVKKSALLYRLHSGNASQDTLHMRKNDFRLLHKHIRRNLFAPRRLRQMLYRYLFFVRWTPSTMIEQARADVKSGKNEAALAKLRYALSFRPYLIVRPWFRSLWNEATSNNSSRTEGLV